MSIVTLARFQFAMTTIFHFFFVPFTIGTALAVAIMELCYVKTNNEEYKKLTKFWGNIMLLSFAVGVVTGIIQEFQFVMNWLLTVCWWYFWGTIGCWSIVSLLHGINILRFMDVYLG